MHTFGVGQAPSTALWEYLSAAKLALEFHKPPDWGEQSDHPLGFAAALLLFCVVDAIGSHLKGTREVFPIGGKNRQIKNKAQHFFVLNGPNYFGQSLSLHEIEMLYRQYRSALVHNETMAAGCQIYVDANDTRVLHSASGLLRLNLAALHTCSIDAVRSFLARNAAADSSATHNLQRL